MPSSKSTNKVERRLPRGELGFNRIEKASGRKNDPTHWLGKTLSKGEDGITKVSQAYSPALGGGSSFICLLSSSNSIANAALLLWLIPRMK